MSTEAQARPRFTRVVETEQELREVLGEPPDVVKQGRRTRLDEHFRRFIGQSPMLMLATSDRQGRCDVSPKGDPAGFVRVLDDHTLVIPDRKGNRMAESLLNLLENPYAAMLFIIPGLRETLRVEGKATIVRDPELLNSLAVQGKAPSLAVVVDVTKVFFHCAKCMMRSQLWQPDSWPATTARPNIAAMYKAQDDLPQSVEEIEAYLEEGNRKRLY